MKYCSKCGHEIMEEAVICPNCGCAVQGAKLPVPAENGAQPTGLQTAAKVFMIVGCVCMAFFLLSLCWTIPMTVTYCNSLKERRPVSVGFKVCSLLFVSLVAGILMLCDHDQDKA